MYQFDKRAKKMNLNQLNVLCPKAFFEWVRSWEPNAEYIIEHEDTLCIKVKNWMLRDINDGAPHSLFFQTYFDRYGISIESGRWNLGYTAKVLINGIEISKDLGEYPDRIFAVESAAFLAFRIREQQLKQLL